MKRRKPSKRELADWCISEATHWQQCIGREDATNKLRKVWAHRSRQLCRIAEVLRRSDTASAGDSNG